MNLATRMNQITVDEKKMDLYTEKKNYLNTKHVFLGSFGLFRWFHGDILSNLKISGGLHFD